MFVSSVCSVLSGEVMPTRPGAVAPRWLLDGRGEGQPGGVERSERQGNAPKAGSARPGAGELSESCDPYRRQPRPEGAQRSRWTRPASVQSELVARRIAFAPVPSVLVM